MQNRTANRPDRNLGDTSKTGVQKATADERVLADEIASEATSEAPAAKTLPNKESVGVPLSKQK